MKIIITGAGGFLGTHLAAYLAAFGHTIYAIVRTEPSAHQLTFLNHPSISIIRMDLSEIDLSKLPRDADLLFTLAQSSHFRNFPEMSEDIFRINVASNVKLWDWARKSGIKKVVHASSGGIYGIQKQQQPFAEENVIEVHSPLGFYLSSKLSAEILLQNYSSHFESLIIMRPFFIYGPNQRKDMLVSRIIDSISNQKPIYIQGEQGISFNPIFIDDAAKAFATASQIKGYHIINAAGPDIVTLKQISLLIAQKLGKECIFEYQSAEPANYTANTKRIRDTLKIDLTRLENGIEKTIEG